MLSPAQAAIADPKTNIRYLRPTMLSKVATGLQQPITDLYSHESIVSRLYATILNGTYSKENPIFWFSKNLVEKAVRKDRLSPKDKLDENDYSDLFSWLIASKNMVVLRECEEGKDGRHKPNLVELVGIHTKNFQIITKTNLIKLREDAISDWKSL